MPDLSDDLFSHFRLCHVLGFGKYFGAFLAE